MELLAKNDFIKVIEPLRQVTINNLFARAVAEQTVTGKIFVDDTENPKTFYIIHPYGMTLLFGESNNSLFNKKFRDHALNTYHVRHNHEWMQAFPRSWDNVLAELFKGYIIKAADNFTNQHTGIIELNTRVNFKFNRDIYLVNRRNYEGSDIRIARTDGQAFRDMKGTVIPKYFWDSEEDFLANGVGYSLFYKGQLASMVFTSYWFDDQFEIGIETMEKFRGKGLAELVCQAIIDYCIEKNYEPIWSCRLENIGSYKLALKLGFEDVLQIPYYRLSK